MSNVPNVKNKGVHSLIRRNETYWRVAHYIGVEGEPRKIKWCYIGKELPEVIASQLITNDYPKINQEIIEQNNSKSCSV